MEIFILAIVAIALKGNFEVKKDGSNGGVVNLITSLVFGFLSAGLVVSTLLTYVSGASFVQGGTVLANTALSTVYSNSQVVKAMIDNYDIWFALPAVVFVLWSVLKKAPEEVSE